MQVRKSCAGPECARVLWVWWVLFGIGVFLLI